MVLKHARRVHNETLRRESIRREHPGRHKPTKAQKADRRARVEYKQKKVITNERERSIECVCET